MEAFHVMSSFEVWASSEHKLLLHPRKNAEPFIFGKAPIAQVNARNQHI